MKQKLMIIVSIAAVFMLAGCSMLEFAGNYLPESSNLEETFEPTEGAQVQPV